MRTSVGDVIICKLPNARVRLVAVVREEGEYPQDITGWRPEGRARAEAMAAATVSNTGGRIFVWNGTDDELVPLDVE